MSNRSTVVIVNGRRYVKPGQVAQRLGVSRATVYRRLPELQAAGVEIIHASERVTLVNEDDLERHLAAKGGQDETMRRRLEALEQARRVGDLICERYGMAPDGWAAQAVREYRDTFGE